MKHIFHPSILREYDIRGVVGATLLEQDARYIGRTFAAIATQKTGKPPRIALGRDGRLSSPALSTALSSGMQEAGAHVINIGLGPTPMLYFAAHHLQTDAGIMVTGSHNPPTHNGFKMMLGHAAFFGPQIQNLGKLAEDGIELGQNGSEQSVDVTEAYEGALLKGAPNLNPQANAKKLRIAWDPGNGATGAVVERLIQRLAGEHHLINGAIDGTFPAHHPDPTVPENLRQLAALVKSKQCDLGIAFDGDGDRLGVIDRQGRILWGDQLLLLYARDMLTRRPGAIVIGDVKSSAVLFEGINAAGGVPLMWKTGHSHMKSKMKETGALLAGEMSGHIFFSDEYYGFDDAIYASLRLVNLLAKPDSPSLEQLLDALPQRQNTPEIRLECADTRKFAVIEEVKTRLRSHNIAFNEVDGIRVETPQGWWLLRASNTGGHLIARAEATSQENLKKLRAEIAHHLRESGVEGEV